MFFDGRYRLLHDLFLCELRFARFLLPTHLHPLSLLTAHLGTLFFGKPVYTHVIIPLLASTRML